MVLQEAVIFQKIEYPLASKKGTANSWTPLKIWPFHGNVQMKTTEVSKLLIFSSPKALCWQWLLHRFKGLCFSKYKSDCLFLNLVYIRLSSFLSCVFYVRGFNAAAWFLKFRGLFSGSYHTAFFLVGEWIYSVHQAVLNCCEIWMALVKWKSNKIFITLR